MQQQYNLHKLDVTRAGCDLWVEYELEVKLSKIVHMHIILYVTACYCTNESTIMLCIISGIIIYNIILSYNFIFLGIKSAQEVFRVVLFIAR